MIIVPKFLDRLLICVVEVLLICIMTVHIACVLTCVASVQQFS